MQADPTDAASPSGGTEFVPGWVLRRLAGGANGEMVLDLARVRDQAVVRLWFRPPGRIPGAFARTPLGELFYRRGPGAQESDARDLADAFVHSPRRWALTLAARFPHLALDGTGTGTGAGAGDDLDAQVRARLRNIVAQTSPLGPGKLAPSPEDFVSPRAELRLDTRGIRDFLHPAIRVGGLPLVGHVLEGIAPADETDHGHGWVLSFRRTCDGQPVLVAVNTLAAAAAPFGVWRGVAVAPHHFLEWDDGGLDWRLASLCAWLLALLRVRLGAHGRVVVPAPIELLRWHAPPALARRAPGVARRFALSPFDPEEVLSAAAVPVDATHPDHPFPGVDIVPGWSLRRLVGEPGGGIALDLVRSDGGHDPVVRLGLRPPGGAPGAFARTPLGDMFLLGDAAAGDDPVAREAAEAFNRARWRWALPMGCLFPHLALAAAGDAPEACLRTMLRTLVAHASPLGPGGSDPVDLLGARVELRLDADGIAAFFGPEIATDGPAFVGHLLVDVSPANPQKPRDAWVLWFQGPGDGSTLEVALGGRSTASEPFALGAWRGVFVAPHRFQERPDGGIDWRLTSLCAWVLVVLRGRLGTHGRVQAGTPPRSLPHWLQRTTWRQRPKDGAQRTELSILPQCDCRPDGTPQPGERSVSLSLLAECHQRCAFCALKTYEPPYDGGDRELTAHRLQLRAARDRGVRTVQLNGIDPLGFSRVLDLVSAVTDFGFEKLTMVGPNRRFADASFLHAFLHRAPAKVLVVLPVYGTTAATHDRVTGAPGSFQDVSAALDHLLAAPRPVSVVLSTVFTRHNVHETADIVAFAGHHRLPLWAQLPYPSLESASTVYVHTAVRETEVVVRLAEGLAAAPSLDQSRHGVLLGAIARHPCVLWHLQARSAVPVYNLAVEHMQAALAGVQAGQTPAGDLGLTGLRNTITTVPCPHAARCALIDRCPGVHYAAYQQIFGLDEFVPVDPPTL